MPLGFGFARFLVDFLILRTPKQKEGYKTGNFTLIEPENGWLEDYFPSCQGILSHKYPLYRAYIGISP